MNARTTLDVSRLPTYAYGQRSLMWWGTAGMVVIEGTLFAIALVAYFYLRGIAREWPLSAPPPDLLYGTLIPVLLVLSGIPNQMAVKVAKQEDLARALCWMLVCLLFAPATICAGAYPSTAL